ncbi:hypothetical protein [Streptomyces flavofungini]|uniref:Uncharacterized protein n=1 Tax=Streptomyces flavofungini TaxID=68200 RepID=A0ABS0XJC2_9ACTN|nr:hypothetical protein [Streptomyces flavofungini]MBJ3813315.1 hypothetical protein [Streptomyces flavofungini]GHC91364.1 hypothetical protein GCM10010349_79630 [Streptomyces flavofungini]
MARLSRPLYAAYGALCIWLAYCAVQSARHGTAWAAGLFAVSSALAVVAAVRERHLEDALRSQAVRAERAARVREHTLGDTVEAAVAVARAGECCETWWNTLGTHHDLDCPNRHRSAP